MEEFVGTAYVRIEPEVVTQVFNGVFEAFLPLPSLGILVGLCLFLRGFGLRVCGVLQRLGGLIGDHVFSEPPQRHRPCRSPKMSEFRFLSINPKSGTTLKVGRYTTLNSVGEHDGYESHKHHAKKATQNGQQRVRLDPLNRALEP